MRAPTLHAGTAPVRTVSIWAHYINGAGLTVTLALMLVLAVTYPIQDAGWVRDMVPLTVIGVLSVGFTTWLSSVGLPGWRAHLWSAFIGMWVVLFVGSALLDNQIYNLLKELNEWSQALGTDEVQSGVATFAVFLTSVTWLLGHMAVWMALRMRQGWAAVALGGTTLAIVLSNATGNDALWLSLFMVASILLLIHMAIAQRMVGWRAKRLSFESITVLSQSGIILIAGVLLILGVSQVPAPRFAPLGFVAEAMEDTAQAASDEFSRLFNGLPSRRHVNTITFEDFTEFRGNPNLTADLLFTVKGEDADYWRARTYTTYTSTGWDTLADWDVFSESGADDDQRVRSEHEFNVVAATDTLFHAGLAAEFDRPIEALISPELPDDPLQIRFTEGLEFFPTRTNIQYTSSGNASTATARTLSREDGVIPPEILRTYTQLPATLPRRVDRLARQLTQDSDTVFDKAKAIENYVKSFPYNLNISAPPEGRDGVDYFLFDLQQGYCDYYASSMTVMLRTLGIPARYVLGYATGQFNVNSNSWEVLKLNYHSWVEVYHGDLGWIRYEPTPANGIEFGGVANAAAPPSVLDPIDFGDGPFPEDDDDGSDFVGDFEEQDTTLISLKGLLLSAVALAVGLLGYVYYRLWWRLGRLPRADELYAKMARMATVLGVPPSPSLTPHEYVESLAAEMPEHAEAFRELGRVYSNRRYAKGSVSMVDLREAENAWRALRWPLLRRMFRVRPA
jgi:transglutaminase-like putative cysteine protease